MENQSLFLNSINKIFTKSQEKFSHFSQNNIVGQNIDNAIFATILGILALSLFVSSEILGYLGLITLFLTVIKLFIKKGEKLEINLFETFLLVYFLIVVISLSGSTLFHLSLKGFSKTITYLGFYLSAAQYYKNNLNKIPVTIYFLGICAGIQAVIGFVQNFAQVGEISTWQDTTNINPEDVMTRVYGTLKPYNPNLFGGYMIATLPCLLGAAFINFFAKNHKFAIGFLAFSGIASVSIILSGCRGAYLALLAIMVCAFGFIAKFIWQNNNAKIKKIFLTILGSLMAIATSAALLVSSVRTRILSIFAMRNDSSTSFRLNVYNSALHMLKDNWLLGIGVGNQNFREIYGLYMRTGFDALSCYNIYLEIAIESGIFALLAFVGFLTILINKTFKLIASSANTQNTVILITAITAIIAISIHGFVDTIFFRPQVQFVFWTMVAFISAKLNSQN